MENEAEEKKTEKEYIVVSNGTIQSSGYSEARIAEEDAVAFAKEEPNEVFEVYLRIMSVKASIDIDKTYH